MSAPLPMPSKTDQGLSLLSFTFDSPRTARRTKLTTIAAMSAIVKPYRKSSEYYSEGEPGEKSSFVGEEDFRFEAEWEGDTLACQVRPLA